MNTDELTWRYKLAIIDTTARIAATGHATFFPAYFGAEPWIGSNKLT